MNVLSLFDGMSCGQIALNRAGIKYDNYFASEIDKNAIKVCKYNYPDTIHIGDVTKVSYKEGVLFTENGNFNIGKIDLLFGGSPCQDFSLARVMTGDRSENNTGLNGDKSSLFYHYLRILNMVREENKEVIWLLENVRMKQLSKMSLDEYLGVQGKYINSSLVSFQNRPRYYWSNILFDLPNDREVSFQEFKQIYNVSKYKLNNTPYTRKMWMGGKGKNSAVSGCTNITLADKVQCLTTKQYRNPNSGLIEYEDFCRTLSQEELEMAQTVPVGYTECLSYGQAQAVLGNGWTVDVIAHILSHIK